MVEILHTFFGITVQGGFFVEKIPHGDFKGGMAKKMLTFKIINQKISVIGDAPVSDSAKYLKAQFYFSGDWSDVNKYALFYVNGAKNPVQIDINSGICLVPAECIRSPYMDVSVYGSNADNKVITTEKVRIKINKSGLAEGNPPLEPPKNIYEKVVEAVQNIEQAESVVVGARNEALEQIENNRSAAVEEITGLKDNAVQSIESAESIALDNIATSALQDSVLTFNEDGTVTKATSSNTVNITFNEDGSITSRYDFGNGITKIKTTVFDGDTIRTTVSDGDTTQTTEGGE